MDLKLHKPLHEIKGSVTLPGSKSISNRVLIIKALSGLKVEIENLSDSDDTTYLKEALLQIEKGNSKEINIGHAGTDMRFLTTFLCIKKGTWNLTGSDRIQQRPIKELVDSLKSIGAHIQYTTKENYPPLLIEGQLLEGGKISIDGSVSSQFISSLLLVAPYFKKGLELTITGNIVSKSYIEMTLKVMQDFGASVSWQAEKIIVKPIPYSYNKSTYIVESDWSAASYYYSLIALSAIGTTITLKKLFTKSIQADSVCETIYHPFGVTTDFFDDYMRLTKSKEHSIKKLHYDFTNCPDTAQTLACTCVALGVPFHFTGLKTLKVKETDRIAALKNEFKKWNIDLITTDNSIELDEVKSLMGQDTISIETYQDHRMAMSFVPLSLKCEKLIIKNSEVVSKSYPLFWEDLKRIGISTEEIK